MRLGETDATKRRVGPLYAVDGDGNPVLGEDFSGAGEAEISVAGGAFGAVTGTFVEIGDGYYYYQAALADATTGPWIVVKISGVCVEFTFREDVADQLGGILEGETDATLLRSGPLRFVDGDNNPLGSGDVGSVVTDISVNGAAWATAAGTLTLIDDGYLYYDADATEAAAAGWFAVRITGPCQLVVFREDIVEVSDTGGDLIDPLITVNSPDPDTTPGDPGGFPAFRNTAVTTPIDLTITDAAPGLVSVLVTARFYDEVGDMDGIEEVVWRDGSYRGFYVGSLQSTSSMEYDLTISRVGGWLGNFIALSVQAVDGHGNVASETFTFDLPATALAEVTEETTVQEGSLDHVTIALARLCQQFRDPVTESEIVATTFSPMTLASPPSTGPLSHVAIATARLPQQFRDEV